MARKMADWVDTDVSAAMSLFAGFAYLLEARRQWKLMAAREATQ